MDYLQWKTQMRSEYFSHNVLAGIINRWKNITADGLFRKNGTTTIWIWKHWNNLMVDNCSKRNSNWEIDDWMVRTEVKISMKKKYSACLYFKLLKSYPNKYSYLPSNYFNVSIFRWSLCHFYEIIRLLLCFFSGLYFPPKHYGKNIRSTSGFFIAGNPFVKIPGFPFLHFRLKWCSLI